MIEWEHVWVDNNIMLSMIESVESEIELTVGVCGTIVDCRDSSWLRSQLRGGI